MVVYSPVILTSIKQISREFGVPDSTVRKWEREGAPIIKDGEGSHTRYRTEKAELWAWYKIYAKDVRGTKRKTCQPPC